MRSNKFSLLVSVASLSSKSQPAAEKEKANPLASTLQAEDDSDPYALAGGEIISGHPVPALWARALVEGNGEDGSSKAAYIRMRVVQLEAAAVAKQLRLDEAAREEAGQAALRVAEVRAFAAQHGSTEGEAEDMLSYDIRMENDQYVLYLDGGTRRYAYDRLDYAVQYAQRWQRHRVPPPPPKGSIRH